mmetsp:Transcript_41832/g.90271  ORF Transcript_41832/g.90271 Transcript_41832/m.90271 type:complete len:201 (+) Transcript_41832:371-973(+)
MQTLLLSVHIDVADLALPRGGPFQPKGAAERLHMLLVVGQLLEYSAELGVAVVHVLGIQEVIRLLNILVELSLEVVLVLLGRGLAAHAAQENDEGEADSRHRGRQQPRRKWRCQPRGRGQGCGGCYFHQLAVEGVHEGEEVTTVEVAFAGPENDLDLACIVNAEGQSALLHELGGRRASLDCRPCPPSSWRCTRRRRRPK